MNPEHSNFNPELKKPEQLQAQTEVFADERTKEFSDDQELFLKHSPELAKITDLNNLPEDTPEELKDAVIRNRNIYVNFLRKEKQAEIKFSKENIEYYNKKFKPLIESIKSRMNGLDRSEYNKLPEFLGSGANGSVFKIEVDGRFYAAKFSSNIIQSNFELKPLLRAKGVPHTAQLEAYSLPDGVVIMELLPGKEVSEFTNENAPKYPKKHIIQLIDTVKQLDDLGVFIDPRPSNFLYDSKEGFSVLDFHNKYQIDNKYVFSASVMNLRHALSARKTERLDYDSPTYKEESFKQKVEFYRVFLPATIELIKILKANYPQVLKDWDEEVEIIDRDPHKWRPPLIRHEDIEDIPEFERLLKELKDLGY